MRSQSAFAALLFLACSDATGSSYTTGCKTSTVEVTVSAGPNPQFSWAPNCGVEILSVHRPVDDLALEPYWGERMWETRIFLRNELKGPITYGVHQTGAEAPDGQPLPVPLESGSTYTVVLLVVANDLSPRLIAGQKSFTP
jgi:hypothetical protein